MADEEKDKKENPEKKDKDSDEKTETPPEKEDKKAESEPPESAENTDKQKNTPDNSGLEEIKAENIRLKAQLEAYKIGFRSETLEDAVTLAENAAERDGTDISAALQKIAEKYPDWKNTGNNSGFKVGAEPPEENKPDESRINNAFGIRKKI